MFGLFSPENNCLVRLTDISKSAIDPALQYAVLAFCEYQGAEKAKPVVENLSGLSDLLIQDLESQND